MELKTTKALVYRLLQEYPATRDDDELLYLTVIKSRAVVVMDMPVKDFFNERKQRGIPDLESVSRARRKVQEEHPELRGKRVEERKKAEQDFRDFSHEKD